MAVDTRRTKENARRRTGQYVEGEAGQGNDPVNRFPAERVDPGRSTPDRQAQQDCAAQTVFRVQRSRHGHIRRRSRSLVKYPG